MRVFRPFRIVPEEPAAPAAIAPDAANAPPAPSMSVEMPAAVEALVPARPSKPPPPPHATAEEIDPDSEREPSKPEIELDAAEIEEIEDARPSPPARPIPPPPPPVKPGGALSGLPTPNLVPPQPRAALATIPEPTSAASLHEPDAIAGLAAPTTPPPVPPARAQQPTLIEPATLRRQRSWWEELFDDDYIRTMDRVDPAYIRHETNFIEESLGVEHGAVILDLACGNGQHAVELASRGYSVVGYDLSLSMLAHAADEAQDRGQKLNLLHGDMREMAFDSMFDGVYCWSTSFGYFDEEKNADVLRRIHRSLRPGGMLLLDSINRDYTASRSPSVVWFEGDGCKCMDDMHLDFFTSRLTVKRTVMFERGQSGEIEYSIRLYALHELGRMLHDAGFKVIEVSGHIAHRGAYFGAESPRTIILAERT